MYPLFELACLLSLRPPGCRRLQTGTESPRFLRSAWSEVGNRCILALVINNGNLLIRYSAADHGKPVVRQLPWLHSHQHQIAALCFDPSGCWLLCVGSDTVLYIIPVLALVDATTKINQLWNLNDVTCIQLTGKRGLLPTPPTPSPPLSSSLTPELLNTCTTCAQPTCVVWWQTYDNQQIAIIGNELGEICFINLESQAEVGGTYITVAIKTMELVRDDSHDTAYLLITGSNGFQWQLLLEQVSSGYRWPLEQGHQTESATKQRDNSEDSVIDHRPQRLTKFAGHTYLTGQYARGHHFITGYYAPTSILSVHDNSLDVVPLFVYKLPPSCDKIVLTDRIIYATSSFRNCLHILSNQLSESSIDGKREANPNAEIQVFPLPNDERVVSVFKCTSSQYLWQQRQLLLAASSSSSATSSSSSSSLRPGGTSSTPTSPRYVGRMRRSSGSLTSSATSTGGRRGSSQTTTTRSRTDISVDDIEINRMTALDGCIFVTETAVYECRPRLPPEKLFLELVLCQQDIKAAERLGIMLSLDVNRLYESAADCRLGNGQFAAAVRLYQLSKCPHVRSVANFAAHGCVAELLSYVRVLFSSQGVEFSLSDKRHFANMALYCYTQQVLEIKVGAMSLRQSFREFLKDNQYYNELLAVQLLAEQGLYDLLLFLAERRGLLLAMAEELLRPILPAWRDATIAAVLEAKGYDGLLLRANNELYLQCITVPSLMQHLLTHQKIAAVHVHLVSQILPILDIPVLERVAVMYDLSRPCVRMFLKRALMSHSHPSEIMSFNEQIPSTDSSERRLKASILIEQYIHIVLMINFKRNAEQPYNLEFMESSEMTGSFSKASVAVQQRTRLPRRSTPIGCGFAHAAVIRNGQVYTWGKTEHCRLGHGIPQQECLLPTPVDVFSSLKLKVIAVACGAWHTLALTNQGLYAWGSSRYGQVGTGTLEKEPHPVMVETLLDEHIVSITCGQYHSMALTSDGRVFTWGWGVHGQLGHGNPDDCRYPRQIMALASEVIVKVAAGYGHSLVLTAKGDVYAFGCSLFGQLGLGTMRKHSLPQHVQLPEKINLIGSGYFHNVAVSASNKIYTWGNNPQALRMQAQASRKARLQEQTFHAGPSAPSHSQKETSGDNIGSQALQELIIPKESSSKGLVPESSSEVSLQETTDTNLNVSSNNAANLGKTGDSEPTKSETSQMPYAHSHLVPTLIDNSNITSPVTQVSCGSHHTALLTVDGEVFTWGRNLDGQLGNGTRKEQKIPHMVLSLSDRKVTHVMCGCDFTIVVDTEGKVWGWGHNDCGQVGSDVESENKPGVAPTGKLITIKTNKRIVQIRNSAQWGVVKPQEILGLVAPSSNFEYEPTFSFEADGSFDEDLNEQQGWMFENLPQLPNYENPAFGSKTLHLLLKHFRGYYDPLEIIGRAVECKNFQAASKVCLLEKQYHQSLIYQIEAVNSHVTNKDDAVSLLLTVIDFYMRFTENGSTEIGKLLEQVIKFWLHHNLPFDKLEELLKERLSSFVLPLSILFFGFNNKTKDESLEDLKLQYVVSRLSTKFCLSLVSALIQLIECGTPQSEFLELLPCTTTENEDDGTQMNQWSLPVAPPEKLWQEVLHNLSKEAMHNMSITVVSGELENLLQTIQQEKSAAEIVLFTCGHHYTSQSFHREALPRLEDVLQTLSYPLARTAQALLASYRAEGFLPMACPRCVLAGIQDEL